MSSMNLALQDLKDRRTALGLTQLELAERAGVSRPTVAHLESGYVERGLARLLVAHALEAHEAHEARPT